MRKYDKIIIGAGIYGLYSALYCGKKGQSVIVLERDAEPFMRATYINQARVHMGYHYPRSLATALKSAGYFKRFVDEFDFCINKKFDQVYATSSKFSWTQAEQFVDFCKAADIPCEEIPVSKYFRAGMCDGAFLTREYTYDAKILRDYFIDEISKYPNVELVYGCDIETIDRGNDVYSINYLCDSVKYEAVSEFVLNATYASVNQILDKVFPSELFPIKYELCEIIICKANEKLVNVGITVMDGPFFSIMPFGKTGYHSLTSVAFTPHVSSHKDFPEFECQRKSKECSVKQLHNCNECLYKPQSAWSYMSHLADKYIHEEYGYDYVESLFSMKPILRSSEIDDSRPTAIKVHSGGGQDSGPTFISVLSGKINTVYDLDEFLI